MTGPRTTLVAIFQDACTAGYAAPAFRVRDPEAGRAAIDAAAAEGAPLVLVLHAADFPVNAWRDACAALNESARTAYGEHFAFALALDGLEDTSHIEDAAAAGFAMCAATVETASAIRAAGMLALRDCGIEDLDAASAGPGDVLALAPGGMPELAELVRATSTLPNVPLALRPGPDALAPAEPAADTFFPTREHPVRAAVRTGVCLVIFETDGAPTYEQVAEAARLTAAQGAARLMERSTAH